MVAFDLLHQIDIDAAEPASKPDITNQVWTHYIWKMTVNLKNVTLIEIH